MQELGTQSESVAGSVIQGGASTNQATCRCEVATPAQRAPALAGHDPGRDSPVTLAFSCRFDLICRENGWKVGSMYTHMGPVRRANLS